MTLEFLVYLQSFFNQIASQTINGWYSYLLAKKIGKLWSCSLKPFSMGAATLLYQTNKNDQRMYPTEK